MVSHPVSHLHLTTLIDTNMLRLSQTDKTVVSRRITGPSSQVVIETLQVSLSPSCQLAFAVPTLPCESLGPLVHALVTVSKQ